MYDISVTSHLERGEKRQNTNKLNGVFTKSESWTKPSLVDVKAKTLNFRKHEGKIYREANGGFETRGKIRFHPDTLEY